MSSSVSITGVVQVAKGWKHRLERLEFKIAVFATSLWAILSMVTHFLAMIAVRSGEGTFRYTPNPWLMHLWLLGSSLTMVCYLGLVWISIRPGAKDLGPEIMAWYPRIPWPLRPLVSLWWLVHFLETVLLSLAIDGVLKDPGMQLPGYLWPVQYLVTYCIIYAGNCYFLLAIGTITRRESVWGAFWRKRFLIDVFLTSIGFFTYLF